MSASPPNDSSGAVIGTSEIIARLVTYLVVLGSTLFVFAQLNPSMLFTNTTDVGGDNAAHVAASYFFVHHLFPHFQLSGWDPWWFGGFPLYVFYFPLPAVITALLSGILSFGAAFKVVTVLGSVFLPLAAYLFGRLAGFRRPVPALMSVLSIAFLFNTSYTIDGGNIPSTLAGEYSFSLSLVFALLFLGALVFSLRTGKKRWIPPILFALTLLCHVVPALFVAGGAAILILVWKDRRRALRIIVPLGAVGALLSAFWLMRFGLDLPYSSSMGYTRVPGFLHVLFPASSEVAVQILAVIGSVFAIVRGQRVIMAVSLMAIGSALAFLLLPSGLVFNGRWLPFWFLTTALVAGYAISEVGAVVLGVLGSRGLNSSLTPVVASLGLIAIVAGYLGVLPFYTTPAGARSFIPSWVAWNYSGYEAKSGWNNYRSMVAMVMHSVAPYGCGRLDYEYSPNFSTPFGSTLAPMSLPMWTNGCIPVAEGVYFESSTSTPFHFLDQAQLSIEPSNPVVGLNYQTLDVADGVRHLALTGVEYFLANSAQVEAQAAADPQLSEIGSTPADPAAVETSPGFHDPTPKWILYRISSAPLVRPLTHAPVIESGGSRSQWLAAALNWYQNERYWPVVLTTSGPASWRRVPIGTLVMPSAANAIKSTRVSAIHTTDSSISFAVSEIGRPVVVNTPYFPNWSVAGAVGPYLASPNMMVVIPTSHHVKLTYGATLSDWAGRIISLIGLATLLLFRRDLADDVDPIEEPPRWVASLWNRPRPDGDLRIPTDASLIGSPEDVPTMVRSRAGDDH